MNLNKVTFYHEYRQKMRNSQADVARRLTIGKHIYNGYKTGLRIKQYDEQKQLMYIGFPIKMKKSVILI